ncbi:uncharacterized protein [Cherax quadricarinatus]|uniref:uncharacterized protein isoform X2 n=1 Tax=Cherax quadricarinatus TaxID=27406 RepID=UPI00387EC350
MRVLVVVALCLVVVMVVVNAGDSSGDKRKKSIKNVSSRQGDKVKKFKTRDEGRRRSPGEVKTLNSRIAEKRSKKHKKRKSSKKTASHQGKKIKKSHHTQGKEAIKKRVLKKTKKGCAGRCVANTRCGKESVIEGKCQDGFQCCISNKRRRKSGAKKVSCLLLQHCNKLRGQCQKKKIGCHDDQMMYKNSKTKKYCSGSCVCCVSAPETCPSNSKCNKKKGVCVSDRNDCNGIVKKGRELCGSSSCVCCKSKGFSCKTKQQCLVLKGVCQPASHTCSGNMLLGSTYCSESDCGCCVTNIEEESLEVLPMEPCLLFARLAESNLRNDSTPA